MPISIYLALNVVLFNLDWKHQHMIYKTTRAGDRVHGHIRHFWLTVALIGNILGQVTIS